MIIMHRSEEVMEEVEGNWMHTKLLWQCMQKLGGAEHLDIPLIARLQYTYRVGLEKPLPPSPKVVEDFHWNASTIFIFQI